MADAGFFRGTSAEQDNRFLDKQKKLLKSMRFDDILNKKVDMEKVNLDVIKPWITKKLIEILGFEDDVVMQYVLNMLESEKSPDPRSMQINITGFLQGKNAREFMKELWTLLVSAQENIGGIPSSLLEKKKEEIKQRKLEQERIQANLQKYHGDQQQTEPDSTATDDNIANENGSAAASQDITEEIRKAKEVAQSLAGKESSSKKDQERSKGNSGHSDSSDSDDEVESRKKKESRKSGEERDETEAPLLAKVKKEKEEEERSRSKFLQPKWRSRLLSSAARPASRDKDGWDNEHDQNVALAKNPDINVVLTGDSIIKGLSRYPRIWRKYFAPLKSLNFGIGGDRTQHVLWRLQNGEIECDAKVTVVLCGTNNIDKNSPSEIAQGILAIVDYIRKKKPNMSIIVCGILPRDLHPSIRRENIEEVNDELFQYISYSEELADEIVIFLAPEKGWTTKGGQLDQSLYFTDHLHLVEDGDEKLAKSICRLVKELLKADEDNAVSQKRLVKQKEIEDTEKAKKEAAVEKEVKRERSSSRSRSRSRSGGRSKKNT
ncbi:uncharacterized protein [Montipora capricornis]|uniref:uncharacterized protein isoform X2 n=1 Tax=Montipora capricornis TaxID=246305 RepID=UPI0035F190FC